MTQQASDSAVTVPCADLPATALLAARLAPHLRPADRVLLDGPLAAGKTAFVALLCQALGIQAVVSSPTYVISHVYPGVAADVVHVDAYRLSGAEEFIDLGLDEVSEQAITLIEWGERVASVIGDHLHLRIEFSAAGDEARVFLLTGHGARWQPVLDVLRTTKGHPA
ncbi:MAG: tRNA (adenosine(37)-N6)-threonylcarbamoyltransferase complex ATPase subunit type 1 TsaE [Pararhodobacter sp.]|nr:tRNA (adenosine(37)-N6)-threonylcarbamoyltransferase complex ATPase subunit type 1 TsaE [Pararhodobacter sp.]